jgi:hypothetical protein
MILCPKLKVGPKVLKGKRFEGSQGAISLDACTKCDEHKGIIGKGRRKPVRVKCGFEQRENSVKIIPNRFL